MFSGVLSNVGWWVLPSMVSGWVQSFYYSVTIRAGSPHPAPGTPRYVKHRRIIQAMVISTYLVYTIVEAIYEINLSGNYYSTLGVTRDATDKEIKTRFRRLAAIHHPDKMTGEGAHASAEMFMGLKVAADVLSENASRWAYERIGGGVVHMTRCVTIFDYVSQYFMEKIVPYYLLTAGALYVMGFFGMLQAGKFWRWLMLVSTLCIEAVLVTRPTIPGLWTGFFEPIIGLFGIKPFVQFQIIALVRRLAITGAIALAQISPVLFPDSLSDQGEVAALNQSLGRLDSLAKSLEKEVTALMAIEIGPFKDDVSKISQMRALVSQWLVQNTIRSDPMVVDAMGNQLRKRRVDAPHGARGRRTAEHK